MPWGQYRYTRLQFGIKAAGDNFIEEMNKIFDGIKGVSVITDDILIYGKTEEEHNQVLDCLLLFYVLATSKVISGRARYWK